MPLFGRGIYLKMPKCCNNAKYKHFKTFLWRYRYSVWERRGHPDRSCLAKAAYGSVDVLAELRAVINMDGY